MNSLKTVFPIYLAAVSLIAVLITVGDKRASRTKKAVRAPEKLLLFVGFIGGAFAMYLTMKLVRHKTKKPLFMFNLPWMILLHAILVMYVLK